MNCLAACQQLEQTLLAQYPADLMTIDFQVVLDQLGDIVGLITSNPDK